ncbi:A/G-specific DNA-adenine glycosylase [Formivibrio citricus]|uniref:Adenine DNA glycosylase n=1 Tax=Formivibrio citricus TaxID=83765 RepID=A0A1I4ZXW2_9NEIS|nr:A/G-specific adenine glycosylase [Formivibrio citricus]SFN54910.1 A/G-specific DNA-adenine glycosylase [Formivibrio citricus]
MTASNPLFADRLIAWQEQYGRHDLPWQVSDPYRIWLSEVMLQQTQVGTVIPYFLNFIARFPDVAALASASPDDVLAAWSGLGYYSRARNLHRAAQMLVNSHGGHFPQAPEALIELPGVGRSTAAAIAVFAFGARAAILDGNVKRVLARWAGIEGWPGEKRVENTLWQLAESLLPSSGIAGYTQGLMDLGSQVCTRTRPCCGACPVKEDCVACIAGRQSQLPAPKPRKTIPERHVVLLLIRDARGRIFLERRPPAGIWGGLWSLPEAQDTLSAASLCACRYGVNVDFDPPLPDVRHTFTHFHLAITPLPGAVNGAVVVTDSGTGWFDLVDIETLGLPAPVRRLLK